MHRRLPCKLSSKYRLLQFGTQQTDVAPSASDLLKLSARGMEILSLSAMVLGTEMISTSAMGDFSSCQAESPPLDTKAVCVEHGVVAELNFYM